MLFLIFLVIKVWCTLRSTHRCSLYFSNRFQWLINGVVFR